MMWVVVISLPLLVVGGAFLIHLAGKLKRTQQSWYFRLKTVKKDDKVTLTKLASEAGNWKTCAFAEVFKHKFETPAQMHVHGIPSESIGKLDDLGVRFSSYLNYMAYYTELSFEKQREKALEIIKVMEEERTKLRKEGYKV